MYVARALGVAVLAAGAFLTASATASASPHDNPVSGDDRATVHAGNATTCEQAGLSGSIIKVTSSVDESNTYIDITALPDGTVVTGVVVKGGPNFNVYEPGDLGALPWLDLHSPLVSSGKPAQISHWYVCGKSGGGDTSTTTPPSSTSPTSTAPTSTSPGAPGGSTSTTPAAQGGNGGDTAPGGLASTGFGNSWLIFVGAALLLGGGALLFLVRRRAS